MKTIMKILVALISIYFNSCSEDIYLHNGEDGKDGLNGKDGHSLVTKVETVYSSENTTKVLGYTINCYIDIDDNLIYSAGDKFDNSITLLNGNDGKDGQNGQNGLNASIKQYVLPPSEECPNGSLVVESYTGTTLTGSISYCIPKEGKDGLNGLDGKDGKDAYNLVMSVKEVPFGNEIIFYWDINNDGRVSEGDLLKGGFVVLNGINGQDGKDGQDGEDGQNGKTPGITFEIIDGYLIINSTLDGQIVSSVSFKLPEDGKDGQDGQDGKDGLNGLTPSLETTLYNNPCGCRGASGIGYNWYFDLNKNGQFDAGEPSSKSIICNGKDGKPSKTFIPLTLYWDFAGQSPNYNYISNGWIFDGSTGVSDGNIYMSENGKLTTPIFRDSLDLLSLTFRYGSSSSRKIKVVAIMDDSSEKLINEFTMQAIPDFSVGDYSKYKVYQYYADLDNIEFKGVKRIRIESSDKLKCVPEDLFIRELILDFNDRNVK